MKSAQQFYLVASFCLIHGQQYKLVPDDSSDEALDPSNSVASKTYKRYKEIPVKSGAQNVGVNEMREENGNCCNCLNARLDGKNNYY